MAIQMEHGFASDNGDWFYYSFKKKSWFRVLVRGGLVQGYYKQISIELTPKGGWDTLITPEGSMERFINVEDPTHHPKDIYTHCLPQEVYEWLTNKLDLKHWVWLLDVDVMRNINLNKLEWLGDGVTYYDQVMYDGVGNTRWMNELKTIPYFYQFTKEVSTERLQEKLTALSDKYKR